MIRFKHKGDFKPTTKFLYKNKKINLSTVLNKYGQVGVSELEKATPKDTGTTAKSWGYRVTITERGASIVWTNSNVVDGVPIAIILQYGHATRNGGYVEGRDYINPALQPVFDDILKNVWREVTTG